MFPGEVVQELREAVALLSASLDASQLDGDTAVQLVAEIALTENMLAYVKAAAAARVAETKAFRKEGHRSAAHHLAAVSGTTIAEAERRVETAQRLQALPATAAAQQRGDLSATKA